jgi:subtilisin family serine protease
MVPVRSGRDPMRWLRLALCVALVAVIAAPGMVSAADSRPGPLPHLVVELPAEAPQFAKGTPRLEGSLAEMVTARARGGAAAARGLAQQRGIDSDGDSVDVMVVTESAGAAGAAVRSLGGTVIRTGDDRITARMPVDGLTTLANSPDVTAVRVPTIPLALTTVSEGVEEIGATVWHGVGTDGTGVKVGVIDTGFHGYSALLGSELPSSVQVWPGGLGAAGVVHGTAVAEVVHDVAPGATLYLAGIGNSVDLYDAVEWMVGEGVTVINQSLAWFGDGPLDGSGFVNEVVSDAVGNGVVWVNAAGNQRERHWAGDFVGESTEWHDFDPGAAVNNVNPFYASAGRAIAGYLWWDDDWDGALYDYDLVLWRYNESSGEWTMHSYSAEVQDGTPGSSPVERVWVGSPQAGWYGWSIYKYDPDAPADVDFDLVAPGHQLTYRVMERSISIPADNPTPGFMSAGAVGRGPGFVLESYSSQGPTRDGRSAPSLVGPSGVSSASYGTFSGTSASSPHLAGAAALVAQQYPEFTPADIAGYLSDNALALGEPNIFGSGVIQLPDPGTPPPVASFTIHHHDAGVTFDRFVTGYSSAYSDSGYVYGHGKWSGTRMQVRFTGSSIRWYGPKQPVYGMADVYVDGTWKAEVDCYASDADKTLHALLVEVDGLDDGPHVLEIRPKMRTATNGSIVVMDYFEVDGANPKGGGTRRDEMTGTLSGPWIKGPTAPTSTAPTTTPNTPTRRSP